MKKRSQNLKPQQVMMFMTQHNIKSVDRTNSVIVIEVFLCPVWLKM